MSRKKPVEQWTQYTPLVEVDIGLFADKVGVATTDTLDLSQGVHDLALAINVGVEETQDVLCPHSQYLTKPHRCIGANRPGIVDGAQARRETWWATGK